MCFGLFISLHGSVFTSRKFHARKARVAYAFSR